MKTTPIWVRTLVMLALASTAAGCASSSGKPNVIDSGTDSTGGGSGGSTGGGSGGASADAGDARTDGSVADGRGDASDMGQPPAPVLSVKQGTAPVIAGSTVTIAGAVVGSTASTVFTIGNTGNAALTVSGVTVDPSGVLSLTTQPGASVAAGSSTMFTVGFSPTAVGTSMATVTITSNAGASFAFTISAAATAAPQPAIAVAGSAGDIASGGTLAFGPVAVGTPKDQTITVRNPGTAPLVLSANPAVSGTGNSDFTLKTPPASLSIASGSMTTFVVTFTPSAKGDEMGTISIANNSPDNATFTITLTGTGTITATGFAVTGASGATSIGAIGGTLQLTATVVPAGADNPGVTWSSGTPGVATVDATTGLVTAVASGQTTITATAADSSGITGTLTITVAIPFVYFVQQIANSGASQTTTASLANGTITLDNIYGASGNAFKFVTPNLFYGTASNGFIAFPTPMTGDFTISATVNLTVQHKANNACGLGVGLTTGFLGTDSYAYALMRNSNPATGGGTINQAYVSSASAVSIPTTVSATNLTGTFTNGNATATPPVPAPVQISVSRTGTNVTFSATPMTGTGTAGTGTVATSALTNGTINYGAGPVYPAISFNNVGAQITSLVVKDATGATVFDSATGILVTYIPASLTLSPSSIAITKNSSGQVTATAVAVGGTVSSVSAVAADPTIVGVSVANGATSSTITLSGLVGGTTNVTVTNLGDSNPATNTKTIQVTVNDFPTTDSYGSLATLAYPAPGATNAYTDGELALTFDAPPTLNPGGSIKIYKKSDGTQVDSINFANETQTFGTTPINVGSQLARLVGNTVFFAPHLGKLAYGTAYYVVIPTPAITGTLTGMAFTGLSNLSSVATWSFTTRAAPTLDSTNITVDGSQASTANFRTVQGALNSLAGITPAPAPLSFTINVAAGIYNELLHYTGPGLTQTVNIIGPTTSNPQGANCIIQYANGNTLNPSTQGRASAYFNTTNLVLENITLRNTAVRSQLAQAEALYFASGTVGGVTGTLAVNNSSFYSNQDTIQTAGRSWFYNCHVEGNVDFIWGTGDVALFESCSLRIVNDIAGGGAGSYSIFVARTGTTIGAAASGTVGKGYVMLGGSVSVDPNVTAFFGRDAGTGSFYDQVALINVMFSSTGNGVLSAAPGLWNTATAPLSLGDSSFVGWKAAGCSGLMADTIVTAAGTSATINSQATEYDTRDHILNRVVTVTTGAPTGYQAATTTTTWDLPGLATAFGAPQ
jgi:hypothetical protein